MSESQTQALVPVQVPYYGETVPVIEPHLALQSFVPVKPFCDKFSLDYSSQLRKLKKAHWASKRMTTRRVTATDGKVYETVCVTLGVLGVWLSHLDVSRVGRDPATKRDKPGAEDLRAQLRRYQDDLVDEVEAYLLKKFSYGNHYHNSENPAVLSQVSTALATLAETSGRTLQVLEAFGAHLVRTDERLATLEARVTDLAKRPATAPYGTRLRSVKDVLDLALSPQQMNAARIKLHSAIESRCADEPKAHSLLSNVIYRELFDGRNAKQLKLFHGIVGDESARHAFAPDKRLLLARTEFACGMALEREAVQGYAQAEEVVRRVAREMYDEDQRLYQQAAAAALPAPQE